MSFDICARRVGMEIIKYMINSLLLNWQKNCLNLKQCVKIKHLINIFLFITTLIIVSLMSFSLKQLVLINGIINLRFEINGQLVYNQSKKIRIFQKCEFEFSVFFTIRICCDIF